MAAGYLITGIPGAGKTTVSAALARRFSRGVHIEADRLQELIVTGGQWPSPDGPRDEWVAQLDLRARNAGALADNFAAADFVPVVDDVIAGRSRLDLYLECLTLRPLAVVVLAPPVEVTIARDSARGYKEVGDTWVHLDQVQQDELSGHGLWLDTSTLTVEQTVDEILAREAEALVD